MVRSTVLCGAFGGCIAGWALCWVTVGLNGHLLSSWPDPLVLALWLCAPLTVLGGVMGGAMGKAVGGVLSIGGGAIRRGPSRATAEDHPSPPMLPEVLSKQPWVRAVLLGAPVGVVLTLPDVGLSGTIVSHALLGGKPLDVLRLAGLLLVFVAATTIVCRAFLAVQRRIVRGAVALTLLGALAPVLLLHVGPRQERPTSKVQVKGSVEQASQLSGTLSTALTGDPIGPSSLESSIPAERVVLVNIDGLDPSVIDVLGPERLPFLWSMREEGTYGPLATEVPTLSPPIWTTLVTGVPRNRHGVRGFLYFQLPGMRQPVWEFPLHSGLNFKLLPWLDGRLKALRKREKDRPLVAQYRSQHRRVPAVWEILEGIGPVGVYRWRVTWPAEQLSGFVVAEGVSQTLDERPRVRSRLGRGFLWPEDALVGVPERRPGEGLDLVERLTSLIEKYDTRLTIAGFSSVDNVQHRYGLGWGRADVGDDDEITRRYQQQDQRLAKLAERLGPDTDFIIVSDHGFSFEHGHHAQAPAGVFFARGPSFHVGRPIVDLSIYDVTPMLINLFGVAQSEELLGVQRDQFRQALRVQRSTGSVPSYPNRRDSREEVLKDQTLEETKERLRSLGYIE